MTVTFDDLRAMSCDMCQPDGSPGPGIVYFHSDCHPLSPTWTRFESATDELVIECADCEKEVMRIRGPVAGELVQ